MPPPGHRAMGDLATHLGHVIESIDLNPLILLESGCVAVDALAVGDRPQPRPLVNPPVLAWGIAPLVSIARAKRPAF